MYRRNDRLPNLDPSDIWLSDAIYRFSTMHWTDRPTDRSLRGVIIIFNRSGACYRTSPAGVRMRRLRRYNIRVHGVDYTDLSDGRRSATRRAKVCPPNSQQNQALAQRRQYRGARLVEPTGGVGRIPRPSDIPSAYGGIGLRCWLEVD